LYVTVHAANAGLATPIAAYYKAKLYANTEWVGLWDASYADIIAYGALLGLARCDGPHVSTACSVAVLGSVEPFAVQLHTSASCVPCCSIQYIPA
jgi:hypothetical protein